MLRIAPSLVLFVHGNVETLLQRGALRLGLLGARIHDAPHWLAFS